MKTKYTITGTQRNGQRFSPINTNTPQHYNIYRGSIWENLSSGKRKRVAYIWN